MSRTVERRCAHCLTALVIHRTLDGATIEQEVDGRLHLCPKRKVVPAAQRGPEPRANRTAECSQPHIGRRSNSALAKDAQPTARLTEADAVSPRRKPARHKAIEKPRSDRPGPPEHRPGVRPGKKRPANQVTNYAVQNPRTAAQIDKILAQPLVRWIETAKQRGRCAICNSRIAVTFDYRRWDTILLNDPEHTVHRCTPILAKVQQQQSGNAAETPPLRTARFVRLPRPTNECPNCGNLLAVYGEFRTCHHCGS